MWGEIHFQRKDALPKSYCFALFYAALSLLQPVLLRACMQSKQANYTQERLFYIEEVPEPSYDVKSMALKY